MAFEDMLEFRPAGRVKPTIPIETRQAVLKRANGQCEQCGDYPTLFAKLELHHLHYDTEGHETPDDLKAYCRSCHRAAHVDRNGDFWADPQEMDNYWHMYDTYD